MGMSDHGWALYEQGIDLHVPGNVRKECLRPRRRACAQACEGGVTIERCMDQEKASKKRIGKGRLGGEHGNKEIA